ncbi:hypothetical protein TSMEX_000501 [Taenia solium]
MQSHSRIVYLLLLLAFATVAPGGDVARKLKADQLEAPTSVEDEETAEKEEDVKKEEKLAEELTESSRRRDVLVPAG